MTNKCKIISQIITLLYISTISGHPQEAFTYRDGTAVTATYRLYIRPPHRPTS